MGVHHKQKPHYSNILLTSKENTPLSTISEKRYKWYLKKELATEVIPSIDGYSHTIQLKFKNNPIIEGYSHISICENRCVICGCGEKLTLHHVIPKCIRKHFSEEHKGHSREWCVLLCVDCHKIVEDLTQPMYQKNFPKNISKYEKYNITLQQLKSERNMNKLHPKKIKKMLEQSDYKSIDDIPPYNVDDRKNYHKSLRDNYRDEIKKWAHEFINSHGGVDGVKQYFRDMFMNLSPQYLPNGYLEINV